jgi:23S rRNA pseudouridine955/2504/2580 synthase
MAAVRYVQVDAEQSGQRLDNFLLAELKGLPRSLVYRVLRTGQVRVNKGRAKADYRICAGDQIRIPPLHITAKPAVVMPHPAQLQQLEAAIIYEDTRMLVLNKPAGLAVHGGSGMSHGVIEAFRVLRTHDIELVHRLDRDTSGCLLLSKRRATLRWLHQALREGTVQKRYIALLTGKLERATVDVDVPLRKNTLQAVNGWYLLMPWVNLPTPDFAGYANLPAPRLWTCNPKAVAPIKSACMLPIWGYRSPEMKNTARGRSI